ncbi:MAG: hypothetical protein HFE51_00110 [Clostridia bacterium]|nr:hypothetical protein [Clostridia bacterium]
MIRYIPFKEILHSDEISFYISFGMKILDNCNAILLSISDISPDKLRVYSLCNLCTQKQLSPIHLYDVIEDIL